MEKEYSLVWSEETVSSDSEEVVLSSDIFDSEN